LEHLTNKLYTDKKVRDGKIRFVFQNGIGNIQKFENDTYASPIAESEIKEILEEMYV
jgi:3-dehydroquinate synthase (EC 4.2.3.4)